MGEYIKEHIMQLILLAIYTIALIRIVRDIVNNKRFLGIMQFLTRIPIKVDIGFDEEFHKGMVYFPCVGFILGVLYFIITYVAVKIFGIYIGTVIFLISAVILTGGLHLDGLADTFDGIYSYRDKDRILEIMKDSRLGTNGLLAILFFVLLKLGFAYMLISNKMYYPLILAPIFGRLAIVFAAYPNESPRKNGMGNVFIGKISEGQVFKAIVNAILMVVVSLIISYVFVRFLPGGVIISSIVFIVLLWAFVVLYTQYIATFIGGITGDILGCTCELSELIYLIYTYIIYIYLRGLVG